MPNKTLESLPLASLWMHLGLQTAQEIMTFRPHIDLAARAGGIDTHYCNDLLNFSFKEISFYLDWGTKYLPPFNTTLMTGENIQVPKKVNVGEIRWKKRKVLKAGQPSYLKGSSAHSFCNGRTPNWKWWSLSRTTSQPDMFPQLGAACSPKLPSENII